MATATRTKVKVITNVSEKQAEEAAQEYTRVENQLAKQEALLNEELNKVKAKYQDNITGLKTSLAEPWAVLEAWAKESRPKWGKRKSIDLLHAVIGFRTGTPKVVKSKNFNWDGILELMKKSNVFSGFIRTKEEINKEAILAEKNEAILNQLKEDCYLSVDQDETFFVEPKVEEV